MSVSKRFELTDAEAQAILSAIKWRAQSFDLPNFYEIAPISRDDILAIDITLHFETKEIKSRYF